MTFGQRLSQLREAKGLSQTALGEGLGRDGGNAGKQVVYGWEQDRHSPNVDQMTRLCRKLGCSADYLLFGQENALSPMAFELGSELDLVKDDTERRRAFYLCMETIRLTRGVEAIPDDSQRQSPLKRNSN